MPFGVEAGPARESDRMEVSLANAVRQVPFNSPQLLGEILDSFTAFVRQALYGQPGQRGDEPCERRVDLPPKIWSKRNVSGLGQGKG